MKRYFVLLLLTLWIIPVAAQHTETRQKERRKMPPTAMEVVSDLSSAQKKQLMEVYKNTRMTVHKLEDELHALRDSIHMIMKLDGDHSARLFPMLDREGKLQALIAKTVYRTRLSIDAILTDEQLSEFRKAMDEHRAATLRDNRGR